MRKDGNGHYHAAFDFGVARNRLYPVTGGEVEDVNLDTLDGFGGGQGAG